MAVYILAGFGVNEDCCSFPFHWRKWCGCVWIFWASSCYFNLKLTLWLKAKFLLQIFCFDHVILSSEVISFIFESIVWRLLLVISPPCCAGLSPWCHVQPWEGSWEDLTKFWFQPPQPGCILQVFSAHGKTVIMPLGMVSGIHEVIEGTLSFCLQSWAVLDGPAALTPSLRCTILAVVAWHKPLCSAVLHFFTFFHVCIFQSFFNGLFPPQTLEKTGGWRAVWTFWVMLLWAWLYSPLVKTAVHCV